MKQELSTSIDFYLESEKTNPFFIHINSNSTSKDLINLRNHAYILNKLSLLHLEHPKTNVQEQFEKQILELYAVCLDAVANNPLMPYKDYYSVKDLTTKIQHYYYLLNKLTYIPEKINSNSSSSLKRKISINEFWPRIRALLISIEQKIPATHQYIRQFVTIRRGLLENDKKYFIAQMMAKKVETKQLKNLIQSFQEGGQNFQISLNEDVDESYRIEIPKSIEQAKKLARGIALNYAQDDLKKLKEYLLGKDFNNVEQQKKGQLMQYLRQTIGDKISGINKQGIELQKQAQDNKIINKETKQMNYK